MPAVNMGLLAPRAQPNPYVVPVEYPGILYEYSMGPARPYRPLDSILDPIGQAASELFGEGSRVVVGSGSNIDHHGDGEALPRHGSNRHETGTAADFTLYRPDGSAVDPMSEDGRAYALRAAELGILGIGFGPEYMGNAYHMDLVEPGAGQGHVWASGASSMADQLIAAMAGNTGVPGGTVASAAGRPASAPLGGSNMGAGGAQQERAPFGQRLRDGFRDGSMWDALAIGLNGMTLRPDPGLQGMVGERMQDRREEGRLNQTAQWLRSIGRDDLAAAVEAGGLSRDAAGGIAFAPTPDNTPADIRSLQMRAEMMGLEPGSEEYRAFIASNGEGFGGNQTAAWLRSIGREDLAAAVEAGALPANEAFEQANSSVPTDYTDQDQMRREFNQHPAVRPFGEQSAAYGRILTSAANPSAAGDLALIFNYMKLLDPGSVVREGEFATAQNAAGVPERVRALYNNVMEGERLTEETRSDFVGRAEMLYRDAESQYMGIYNQYLGIIEGRGWDAGEILIDRRYIPGGDVTADAEPAPDAPTTTPPDAPTATPTVAEINAMSAAELEELDVANLSPEAISAALARIRAIRATGGY